MLDGRVRPPDPEHEEAWPNPAAEAGDLDAASEPDARYDAPEVTGSVAPEGADALAPAAAPPSASASAAEPPGIVAAVSSDLTTAWSKLDRVARLLATGSAAAFLITLVGLPLGTWASGQFAFIVLVASVVAFVAAFVGATPAARNATIPLATIELWATHVVAVLAILKVLELAFDLNRAADVGSVLRLAFAIGLVVAVGATIFAFNQRASDPYAGLRSSDQGTRLAVRGLALVLLGWAYNLSVSFWTMGQAALPLAVLTLAALVIVEARRIHSPVPVAWIGAAIGSFGALLLLGNWSALLTIGRTQIVLDPPDLLGFIAYSVGTALIVAGGFLSGRDAWSAAGAATEPPAEGPVAQA